MDSDLLMHVAYLRPSVQQEPVERSLAIVVPTHSVQTYKGDIDIAPSTSRKDLANWSWVRLSNTRARCTNHNNNRPDQRWQRPSDNMNDRTLDEMDHEDPDSTERNAIPSDEDAPGLEDWE